MVRFVFWHFTRRPGVCRLSLQLRSHFPIQSTETPPLKERHERRPQPIFSMSFGIMVRTTAVTQFLLIAFQYCWFAERCCLTCSHASARSAAFFNDRVNVFSVWCDVSHNKTARFRVRAQLFFFFVDHGACVDWMQLGSGELCSFNTCSEFRVEWITLIQSILRFKWPLPAIWSNIGGGLFSHEHDSLDPIWIQIDWSHKYSVVITLLF